MASRFSLPPQLASALRRLEEVPLWVLLSLVLNGLLFITVLVLFRQIHRPAHGVLSTANAFAADGQPAPVAPPTLGDRRTLDYQQWVALLGAEATAAAQADLPRQTVLLGDSISLWFPAALLPGRRTWLNQAISGENSSGLLNRLPLLNQNDVESAFIMIGINDLIWGRSSTNLTHNLRAIIRYLQTQHPQAKIVVQSILPHGGPSATWEGRDRLLELSPDHIVAINAEFKQIAAETGVEYLDLYPLFVNGEGFLRPDLTTDGLHLNANGYLVWRSALALYNETDYGR
ncbi:MAG: GDSL-type esterase/lipase family protein [Leptolyngbya sp.]|nr:GDSL-type esterase/lipase family protein [Leptolyngbya sp.]